MRHQNGGRSALVLVLVLVALAGGCTPSRSSTVYPGAPERYEHVDELDVLLMKTGVELTEFPAEKSWSVQQARDLVQLLRLRIADGNISAYGPRVMVAFLLEEGLRTGKPITRRSLTDRLRSHTYLAVLNPEGHLVRAHTGTILLCVGPLHVQNGVPQAGGFKVDTFYAPDGNSYREEPSLVAPAIFMLPEARKTPGQLVSNSPR